MHNEGKVFYLNQRNQYQFSEYKYFNKIYSTFSSHQKKEILKREKDIKKRILAKLSEIGSTYISKSSFQKFRKKYS